MKKFAMLCFMLLFATVALAQDTPCPTCPAPKHLNCQDLKDLNKRKNCAPDLSVCQPCAACATCPTCPECKACPSCPPPPAPIIKKVPGPIQYIDVKPPREVVRPLVGGEINYRDSNDPGHPNNIGWAVFTGMQFPKDKFGGNWQWQIGGGFTPTNPIYSTSLDCQVDCPTCPQFYGGQRAENVGHVQTSVVYVFGMKSKKG